MGRLPNVSNLLKIIKDGPKKINAIDKEVKAAEKEIVRI